MLANAQEFRDLSIYLTYSSDMPSILALVKDMTIIFSDITWIGLWFDPQFIIVSFLLTHDLHLIYKSYIATRGETRTSLFILRFAWDRLLSMASALMEMQNILEDGIVIHKEQ